MGDSSAVAWVVSWGSPYMPGRSSSVHASETEAQIFAQEVSQHQGVKVQVRREADLGPDDLYAQFVERLGVETSPGIIMINWGDYRGVEISVDPQWVASAYLERDPHDDSNFPGPAAKSVHPRRAALDNLLFDLLEMSLAPMEDLPRRFNFGPEPRPH